MSKIAFSDAGLRSIQPPVKGAADYWDEKLPGFGLRVSQGGTKTFVLNIDKSRRAIGRYPIISLSDARTEAKRLLAEKTLGKVRPSSITMPQALATFLKEKRGSRRPRTVHDLESRLKRHFPHKGQLLDADHSYIERRLARIKTNREHNHALRVARTFFTWATRRRYISDNPTIGFEFRTTQSRTRVLSDRELQCIWRACTIGASSKGRTAGLGPANGGSTPSAPAIPENFATIVKLLILTGQRRTEVASLQTSWLDLKNKTLTLPASSTKNGREHTFPLSATADTILRKTTVDQLGPLVFPARGTQAKPFNGWSKSKAALDKRSRVKDWTLHDLRRTFATKMADLGVEPHVIERLLNHISGQISGVAAVYNRATYLEPMRAAIDTYEAHLQNLFARA